MRVLITGISGKLGRTVTELLLERGHEVLGIDRRPWPDAPRSVETFREDIRKRPAENVFRSRQPDAVIHMATVTHFTTESEERSRINLRGTRAVFEHCHEYDVERAIFVGRHTVYGAAPDAPLYYTEDEPPLAVSTFPELSDLVGADLFAGSALWRWPEMDTCVLRMCYTLGPSRRGTLANYLAGPRVPTVLGFDPLYQFVHERDAARAVCAALDHQLRGVYNVAGPQPVPLSLLIEVTGRRRVPVPERLFGTVLGRFGMPDLPKGAVSHVKYPVVVDDSAFREATDWSHEFDEGQAMEAFRWAA